jgi:hypothetical protein
LEAVLSLLLVAMASGLGIHKANLVQAVATNILSGQKATAPTGPGTNNEKQYREIVDCQKFAQ